MSRAAPTQPLAGSTLEIAFAGFEAAIADLKIEDEDITWLQLLNTAWESSLIHVAGS